MVIAEHPAAEVRRSGGSAGLRRVPQDIRSEQAVIGSILLREGALEQVSPILRPGDFHDPRHAVLYGAALDVWENGETVDSVTVGAELERRGRLEDAGGHGYIATLQAELPTPVGVEYYARAVQRTATYRDMISAAGEIADLAYTADPNVEGSLTEAVELLYSVRGADQRREFRPLRDLLNDVLQPDEEAPEGSEPVRSGFADLDKLLNEGLHASDLVVLAARPAVGKSALALGVARNAALGQGSAVAMFSLEMSAEQVAARLVSAESGVEHGRLRAGRHTDEQEQEISHAIAVLSRADIYIDDTAGQTLADIRSKSRNLYKMLEERTSRAGRGGGLGLIIVDHIQLVHAWSRAPIETNRVAEMSMVSRTLKEIARELRVPVLALSQLSRAIEKRQPPTPMLSDLRESGSIEQDADVVVFLTRPDMKREGPDDDEDEGYLSNDNQRAELLVAKHRNGATGRVEVRFIPRVARFEDYYPQEPPPGWES